MCEEYGLPVPQQDDQKDLSKLVDFGYELVVALKECDRKDEIVGFTSLMERFLVFVMLSCYS